MVMVILQGRGGGGGRGGGEGGGGEGSLEGLGEEEAWLIPDTAESVAPAAPRRLLW